LDGFTTEKTAQVKPKGILQMGHLKVESREHRIVIDGCRADSVKELTSVKMMKEGGSKKSVAISDHTLLPDNMETKHKKQQPRV